jgi:hypothetical protein
MDIFKNIHDSLHPNLNSMDQVPYLKEIHLTFNQTAINEDKKSIISKDTMICI